VVFLNFIASQQVIDTLKMLKLHDGQKLEDFIANHPCEY